MTVRECTCSGNCYQIVAIGNRMMIKNEIVTTRKKLTMIRKEAVIIGNVGTRL